MSNTETTPATPRRFHCRHIHAHGRRCGSPALRGEHFCYFHHHTHTQPEVHTFPYIGPNSTFTLPSLEDRASIQLGLAEIARRLALNQLDTRRAGLLLYALQIAAANLPREPRRAPAARPDRSYTTRSRAAYDQDATHPDPLTDPVEVLIHDPIHGPIAPEAEILPPEEHKSLAMQMVEQLREKARLAHLTEDNDDPHPTPYQKPAILPQLQAAGCPMITATPLSWDYSLPPRPSPSRPQPMRRQLAYDHAKVCGCTAEFSGSNSPSMPMCHQYNDIVLQKRLPGLAVKLLLKECAETRDRHSDPKKDLPTMRLSLMFLAPVALLGLSLSAQASDITYNVTAGTLSPTGTFFGSFLINSTTEDIDGGSFTVTAPSGGSPVSLTTFTSSTTPGLGTFSDAAGDSFRFAIDGTLSNLQFNTFANYGSGSDTAYFTFGGTRYEDTGGTITAAATSATPEPSSLVLLGTGALGVAGAFRRRFLA